MKTHHFELNPFQVKLLQLLANGHDIKNIAINSKSNYNTINSHLKAARKILSANNSCEAVAIALRNKIIQ